MKTTKDGGKATLTVTREGEATIYVVDCDHGTTRLLTIPGRVAIPELAAVQTAIARHYSEEGCHCTRQLRKRYGVPHD